MIHAFPGMGADHRMYPAPWCELREFSAHDWVRHAGEKSIPEVAQRMCEACGIKDGDIVIGSSLGGMVACEVTKLRQIPLLVLVGSAEHSAEVNGLLATIHPLAKYAPFDWIRLSAGKIPHELAEMFSQIEASFVRAMCAAIFEWEGGASSHTKVLRIHGSRDLVIPAPSKVDLLLDAGHLVSMTHPRECVEFMRANQTLQTTPMTRSVYEKTIEFGYPQRGV